MPGQTEAGKEGIHFVLTIGDRRRIAGLGANGGGLGDVAVLDLAIAQEHITKRGI